MHSSEITRLKAIEIRAALSRGKLTPRDIAEAYRSRIQHRESQIGAFAHLDWNTVDKQIKALRNQPTDHGPLWGVPVAIKDIYDTADMPTSYGSDIYTAFRPPWDAAAVARLRAAGAVILGKTVTTEFAWRRAARTRNPHDPRYSPGGSSSGSAASVADRMVPLAIGSQTAGSVIRPAAYCGVVGFKPGYGLISLAGVKPLAASLDTAGVFARSVADAALIASIMAARPEWHQLKAGKRAPKMAAVRTAEWDLVADSAMKAFNAAADEIAGKGLARRKAPKAFNALGDVHATIMSYEGSRDLAHERRQHAERLSPVARALIDEGAGIAATTYLEAMVERDRAIAALDDLFGDAEILIAPSATGEPPRFEEGTGDPVMNKVWTMLKLPVITLPAGRGLGGMPLGIQLAARPGEEAKLLATALWAEARLAMELEPA